MNQINVKTSALLARYERIKAFVGSKTLTLFLFAVVLGVGWFMVETSFVYILQIFLVTIGLVPRERTILPQGFEFTVWSAVIGLVSFGLVRSVIIFLRIYVSGITSQHFVRMQRSKLLEIGLHRKSVMSSHELTVIFNETVTRAGTFLTKASESTISLTACVFFFAMGLYLAPLELGIALIALSTLVIPLKYLDGIIRNSGVGLQTEYEKVNQTLLSTLKNKIFLDILGQTQTYVTSGKENLVRYEGHYRAFYRMIGLKSVIPNFSGTVIMAGVTILSAKYLQTEPMKLVGFFYVFMRLAQSASEASGTLGDCRLHFGAIFQLNQIREKGLLLDTAKSIPRSPLISCDTIRFENVQFAYDSRTVVQDLDLELRKGDRLLLRGPSGSGKSTIILLMSGLIQPTRGRILYDGRDNSAVSLSQVLSYAGPEPFLTDGTVRKNLLFGNNPALSDQRLIEVCELVGFWETIKVLPGRLDFVLNENAQLSTGQRQRLALARSILRDSQVLIFDEATSNIDFESEQKIFGNIERLLTDKITVFISHRDSLRPYVNKELDLSDAVSSVRLRKLEAP